MRHQDGCAEVAGVLAVVTPAPEPVVVGVAGVPLLGVLDRTALGGSVTDRVGEGLPHRVGRHRLAEAEVEGQRGVEALVGRLLGVEEVAHAVAVGVAVPPADRGDRHDRLQLGHLRAARGDHRGRGAVVRPADHRDPAVGPAPVRQPLHDVDAGLLLGATAVVPAAGRPAGADHVGDGPGVPLRHEGLPHRVAGGLRLGQGVVGRVGEDHRLLARVEGGVTPDLDADDGVPDGGDVLHLVDLVGLRCRRRRGRARRDGETGDGERDSRGGADEQGRGVPELHDDSLGGRDSSECPTNRRRKSHPGQAETPPETSQTGLGGSPGWTRTNNPPVNSRMLCQLSYRGWRRGERSDVRLAERPPRFESTGRLQRGPPSRARPHRFSDSASSGLWSRYVCPNVLNRRRGSSWPPHAALPSCSPVPR